MQEISS